MPINKADARTLLVKAIIHESDPAGRVVDALIDLLPRTEQANILDRLTSWIGETPPTDAEVDEAIDVLVRGAA